MAMPSAMGGWIITLGASVLSLMAPPAGCGSTLYISAWHPLSHGRRASVARAEGLLQWTALFNRRPASMDLGCLRLLGAPFAEETQQSDAGQSGEEAPDRDEVFV